MPGIQLERRKAAKLTCPAASDARRKSSFPTAACLLLMCALGTCSASAQPRAHTVAHTGASARERATSAGDHSNQQRLAQWIAQRQDHQGKPFFLVDKANASLYVYDRHARLLARSPVLVGAAVGDDSVPGIGERPMAQILPSERTTPAGRFVAEAGRNLSGEDVVWIDHDAAVSMHRLRSNNPLEHRAQRMYSPRVDDNRISYGCINVPVAFYNRYIQPAFMSHTAAMVYVLPETRSMEQQFGMAPASDATSPTLATRLSKR